MPDTGAPYYLPYPTLSDEADFPSDDQALAVASHAVMATPVPMIALLKNVSQTIATANAYATILWDYAEPGQQGPGISYAAGIFTVTVPGLYLINITLYWAGPSIPCAPTLLLHTTPAGGIEVNVATLIQYQPEPAAQCMSRSWRFGAGDTFRVMGRCNQMNAIAYGSGTRYSNMDATWISN